MLRETLFASYKLANSSAPPLAVPTPEWPDLDGQVFVRKLTAGELDTFYAIEDEGQSTRARFVALVACDASNVRHFRDTDVADVAGLAFDVVDRISLAGQKFNGMLKEQQEAKVKNL